MARVRELSLLVALVVVAGCGGSGPTGSNGPESPPPPQANDVEILSGASSRGSGAFDPNPKTVALAGAADATVRWVNLDTSSDGYSTFGVTHRIRSNDGTSFDTGDIVGNDAVTKTLTAGTYAYHCVHHPAMTGTVNVTP